MVGVVGEVVAHQRVEQVGLAAEVGVGEGDELAVARGHGPGRCAGEVASVSSRQQGRGHQDRDRRAGGGEREHLGRGGRVAADQAA